MRVFKLFALTALAMPAIASAQVGPNPAVPNGSLSPSVGGSTDAWTAPQDAQIGGRASGNIIDRTIDTRADARVETDSATSGAATDDGATATGTRATVGTETRANASASGMKPAKRPR